MGGNNTSIRHAYIQLDKWCYIFPFCFIFDMCKQILSGRCGSLILPKTIREESLEFHPSAVSDKLISEFKHYFHSTYIPF